MQHSLFNGMVVSTAAFIAIFTLPLLASAQSAGSSNGDTLSSDVRQLLQSTEAIEAYRVLVATEVFADRAVGYSGTLSDQVRAFRVLMARPNAGAIFNTLFRDATNAGKLYALCGLYHHDRTAFAAARAAMFPLASVRVRTQFGCMGGSEPIGALIESNEPNAVRLAPGQTLEQWLNANGGSGVYDIAGGGYPVSFAGSTEGA